MNHTIMMSISRVVKQSAVGLTVSLALWAGSARADTTINANGTFTIDNNNTTLNGNTRTWNDTGTLTMYNGATLQTQPTQINTVANNDAIVFTGTGGTYTFRFNDNDTDFMMNGAVTSTATGAQTLAIYTGSGGNGDRESVTFISGIPNVSDGSALSLTVNFRTQTGSQSWVNLPAVNTFTGPITLVQGSGGPPTGYLTIGGRLTQFNGNTSGSGTLNSGNYAGTIALGTATIFNYASFAPQTLSGVISGVGAVQVTGSGALTLSGTNTYTGNTTINSGGTLTNSGGLKFVVTDAANNKITGGGTARLNGSFTFDTSAVTVTSGSWTLVDLTTKTYGGSFSVAGFTGPGPVWTKVVGPQNWSFSTTTGVLSLSSKAIITAFGLPGNAGGINQVAKTIALTVPYGTSLTTLAPTFTLTSGTCNQTSGSPPSPTFSIANPAHYVVTDGSVTNDYAVTVWVVAASTNKDILTFTFPSFGAAAISGTNIVIAVPANTVVTNLAPTYTVSQFATASPVSGATNDFTTPRLYTVTAQDGSTKSYLVTVQSYASWQYSASFYVLTTPDGANLPASANETNFPLLLRLNSTCFNFSQAKPQGNDIRFATAAGARLPYQIEQWDTNNGVASVWLTVPRIVGNARQELKMYWGKADAVSESSGTAVFNVGNGYVSVFHLNETLQDAAGSVTPVNSGTTVAAGIIGKGRHITMGTGINCGDSVTNYPYSGNPFTTEAWFRPELGGTYVVYWGRYPVRYNGSSGGDEVFLNVGAPPSLGWGGDGGGGVGATTTPVLGQWYHVAGTFASGTSRVFVNGRLDGTSTGGTESIYTNIQVKIGGMRGSYDYAGDVDEVRVSSVARSTNWIWLEYQNQNPVQALVGPLVQPGSTFSVAPSSVTMNEATVTNIVGQAGGAQKIYWVYKKSGQETVLAVDQFTLSIAAGRVTGDQSFVLQFKAIYPTGVQTNDIPVTIKEYVPDPVFTLTAPATWDGRQTITVTPNISNWSALQAQGVTNLNYTWTVGGIAVTKQITPGVLTLLRAQGSGPMTVALVMDNGGALVANTATITVQEPASDAWVARTPGATETPVNGQFYARDNTGFGKIYYNGTLSQTGTNVYLKVYTNGPLGLYTNVSQTLPGNKVYALSARIAAGLVKYTVEFGYVNAGTPTLLSTVTNVVCGDAYIIDGQSNAVADNGDPPYVSYTSDWIRSFGTMNGGNAGGWCNAVASSASGSPGRIGYWGIVLASNLVASCQVPICIINDSVGGTRIDQHQANPANHYSAGAGNTYSIYSSILNRVASASLTNGIRGVLWHQGENNSGAADPSGDWDYKAYQQYFVEMSAAWKQDYPNIQHYYVYQVWPLPCAMGPKGDQLREAQRTLPRLYSNMGIMSTIGITESWGTRGLCHFDGAGYIQIANLMAPLVKQDNYGLVPTQPITAPDLKRAWFTTSTRNEIALEFGQPMAWNSAARVNLFLDKVAGKVSSGSASGNVIKLQLTAASTARTIDYLEDAIWDGNSASLLRGSNGIAALTFADVPIAPPPPGITSLAPVSGRTNGGTVVTLTGSNFLSGATMQFGGSSATAVSVNNSTQVMATTPAHGAGVVSVVVSNTNGLSATNQFTYVLPPVPATLGGVGQLDTNLVVVWAGGANQSCVLLSATNAAQPRCSWVPVATNAVGPNGLSTNRIPVAPGDPQRFYLLSIPYN